MERWKGIAGFSRYEVSDCGRVRSSRGVLSLKPHRDGHQQVCLYHNDWRDGRTTLYVHTLVLEAFVGSRPDGKQARHLNGDPSDNHINNLVWGSQAENYDDRRQHGGGNHGDRNGRTIFTPLQIVNIRQRYASGETQTSIAFDYDTTQPRISEIVLRKSWRMIA